MTSPAIMIATALAMLYCSAAPVAAQQVDAPKSPGDSVRRDSIRNCVRSCAGGESMPALVYFPRIDAGDVPESQHQSAENPTGAGGLGQVGMHGSVAYTLVVTATGEIDRSTVRVYSSTAKNWEPVLKRALEEARFRPASDSGRAVRARVLVGFDIRAEGFAGLCLAVAVRSSAAEKPLQFCYEGKGGE